MNKTLKSISDKRKQAEVLQDELEVSLYLNELMGTKNVGYGIRIDTHVRAEKPRTLSVLRAGERVGCIVLTDAPPALKREIKRKYNIEIKEKSWKSSKQR